MEESIETFIDVQNQAKTYWLKKNAFQEYSKRLLIHNSHWPLANCY